LEFEGVRNDEENSVHPLPSMVKFAMMIQIS
jgi:hypothetical protein